MTPPTHFIDRHRVQTSLHVDETQERLVVGPMAPHFPGRIGFGFVAQLDSAFMPVPWPVVVGFAVVSGLSVPGLLYALAAAEHGKGPVLEVDWLRGVVLLPRDGREVAISQVIAIAVLAGRHLWTDAWDQVSELSLILAPGSAGEDPEVVPIVLVRMPPGLNAAADRVATLLNVPVERGQVSLAEARARAAR